MNTPLVAFFRHNLWANLRLLDFCVDLSDDLLDASALGTYGSVRATFMHIVGNEERYGAALAAREFGKPVRDFPGFAALRERLQQSGEELIAIAAKEPPDRMLSGVLRGESYTLPAAVLLIQAINHATEHRGHIASILSQHGATPPALDGWAFEQSGGFK